MEFSRLPHCPILLYNTIIKIKIQAYFKKKSNFLEKTEFFSAYKGLFWRKRGDKKQKKY